MKKTRSREAADLVGPLAEAAADRISAAADRLSPLAHSAADRIAPLAHSAADAVSPYAQQAADRLTPLATSVKERGAEVLHDASERFGPRLDEAMDRVGPAVEAARDKVSDDLLPKLTEVLAAAAASPLAVEAISRGKATIAAATGELALPPEKPKGRWFKRLAVVAGLGGLAYVLARKFLGSKDSEWQTARPTTPYAPPKPSAPAAAPDAPVADAPASDAPVDLVGDVPTAEHEAPGDDPQAGASAHTEYLDANGDAEPNQPAEGGVEEAEAAIVTAEVPVVNDTPSAEIVTDFGAEGGTDDFSTVADANADSDLVYVTESETDGIADLEPEASPAEPSSSKWSGEGVYVGAEPPEGYTIKGNERSMKYHLPESGGYARTIAEVWFDSEESAQAAGFIRAQR